MEISLPVGEFAFYNDTPLTFGPAAERKLTLTGGNSGNNTLASVIANASDGGLVGLTKTGGGKWIVTANNTYGGTTNVNAGTLLINGIQTGTGLTTVNSGGTLGRHRYHRRRLDRRQRRARRAGPASAPSRSPAR